MKTGSTTETSHEDLVKGLLSLGREPAKVMSDGRTVNFKFTADKIGEH